MPLKILINGAGICGPALALHLLRSDTTNKKYEITVVERAPALRTGGQQIDIRAQGIPIMQKLGLMDAVRARSVPEQGVSFVNARGKVQATFAVNAKGAGEAQAAVSEFEIMRGDLVGVLYEASVVEAKRSGALRYEFGRHAVSFDQEGDGAGVDVGFSDGSKGRYDLVVGADGQASKTRRLVFGNREEKEGKDGKGYSGVMFKSLGLWIAYFTIPQTAEDKKSRMAKACHFDNHRLAVLRTADARGTQPLLGVMYADEALEGAVRSGSVEEQKRVWAGLFEGCGWEMGRVIEGMMESEDFYRPLIGQAWLEAGGLSRGRVVLLGDAGYCPSPITGFGTTASLFGAYVLAGELARHGDDVAQALAGYDRVMKPFVKKVQALVPGVPALVYPKTQFGVGVLHFVVWLISALRLDKLALGLSQKEGIKIPEYPELGG